jgi:hypothetical protein
MPMYSLSGANTPRNSLIPHFEQMFAQSGKISNAGVRGQENQLRICNWAWRRHRGRPSGCGFFSHPSADQFEKPWDWMTCVGRATILQHQSRIRGM